MFWSLGFLGLNVGQASEKGGGEDVQDLTASGEDLGGCLGPMFGGFRVERLRVKQLNPKP